MTHVIQLVTPRTRSMLTALMVPVIADTREEAFHAAVALYPDAIAITLFDVPHPN